MNNRFEISQKVSLIYPYYGSFPNYFSAWYRSACSNDKIDFYIITDIDSAERYKSRNVHIVHMALQEIRDRLSKVIGGGGSGFKSHISSAIIDLLMVRYLVI